VVISLNKVGRRLKKARQNKGLTQVQVKRLTNINNKTLSGYENGVSEPDYETLKTLADLYNVSTDYLLGRTDDPGNSKNPTKIDIDAPLHQENFEKALQKIAEIDTALDLPDEDILKLIRKAKEKFVNSPKQTQIHDGGENIAGHSPNPQSKDNNNFHPDWEKLIPRNEINVAEATVKVQEIVYEHQLPEEARKYLTRRVFEIYGKPEYPQNPGKAAHGPKIPGQINFDDEDDEDKE
jgi:transcriptional regulator with XRE-family HTH domain